MNRVLKIVGFISLAACAIVTVWRTAFFFNGYYHEIADFYEKASYVFLAGVILVSFAFLSRKVDRLWAKLLIAFAHSSVYIIALFFENAFYQYVFMNNFFKSLPKITYTESLMISLRYYIKNGSPHYMLAFLFIMALCAGIIIWRTHKFAELRSALHKRLVFGKDDTEDYGERTLTEEYIKYTSIEEAVVDYPNQTHGLAAVKYILALEKNEENKLEMIRCAEKYEWDVLLDVLFKKYKELITKDEYIRLRTVITRKHEETIARYSEQMHESLSVLDKYYKIGDGVNDFSTE